MKYNVTNRFSSGDAYQEDIGVQSKQQFAFSEGVGIALTYTSEDNARYIINLYKMEVQYAKYYTFSFPTE